MGLELKEDWYLEITNTVRGVRIGYDTTQDSYFFEPIILGTAYRNFYLQNYPHKLERWESADPIEVSFLSFRSDGIFFEGELCAQSEIFDDFQMRLRAPLKEPHLFAY